MPSAVGLCAPNICRNRQPHGMAAADCSTCGTPICAPHGIAPEINDWVHIKKSPMPLAPLRRCSKCCVLVHRTQTPRGLHLGIGASERKLRRAVLHSVARTGWAISSIALTSNISRFPGFCNTLAFAHLRCLALDLTPRARECPWISRAPLRPSLFECLLPLAPCFLVWSSSSPRVPDGTPSLV